MCSRRIVVNFEMTTWRQNRMTQDRTLQKYRKCLLCCGRQAIPIRGQTPYCRRPTNRSIQPKLAVNGQNPQEKNGHRRDNKYRAIRFRAQKWAELVPCTDPPDNKTIANKRTTLPISVIFPQLRLSCVANFILWSLQPHYLPEAFKKVPGDKGQYIQFCVFCQRAVLIAKDLYRHSYFAYLKKGNQTKSDPL